jgi:hypothetical protein
MRPLYLSVTYVIRQVDQTMGTVRDGMRRRLIYSALSLGLACLLPSVVVAQTCTQIEAQIQQLDLEKNRADGCSLTVPNRTVTVPGQIAHTGSCTPDAAALAAFMAQHQDDYSRLDAALTAHGCRPTCPALAPVGPVDADGDGIPDAVEVELIERFAPYLRFTVPPLVYQDNGADPYRPMDPLVYVMNAKLVRHNHSENLYLSNDQLKNNPDLVLSNSALGAKSDLLDRYEQNNCVPGAVGVEQYALEGLDTGPEKGADWSVVLAERHVGLFAHVSPFHPGSSSDLPALDPVRRYINGTKNLVIPLSKYEQPTYARNCDAPKEVCYKIEYYQFFGKNDDFQAGIGNHQADLSILTMVYNRGLDQLVAVSHWAHGYEMRFDLLAGGGYPNCPGATDRLIGRTITCSGQNASQKDFNILKIVGFSAEQDQPEKAQNNVISFSKDPKTGKYTHPVVFVEAGSHEFWPTKDWGAQGAPSHNGDDKAHHYLAANIPNLGEIEHPMGDEARIFIQYDGYWGNNYEINDVSPGPSLHASWNWYVPGREPIHPSFVER